MKINANQSEILEAPLETDEMENLGQGSGEVNEAVPEDFKLCLTCKKALNEDERIINARFVNEALE